MSKYFYRNRQPSTEEIVAAILDIETRLDEAESENSPRSSLRELKGKFEVSEHRVENILNRFMDELDAVKESVKELVDGKPKL